MRRNGLAPSAAARRSAVRRDEVAGNEAEASLGKVAEARRRVDQAKVALEDGVDLDAVVGADDQRARRRGFEQGAQPTRGADERLGAADAPRGKDRQPGGDRHPQHRNDDDRPHRVRADRHVSTPARTICVH